MFNPYENENKQENQVNDVNTAAQTTRTESQSTEYQAQTAQTAQTAQPAQPTVTTQTSEPAMGSVTYHTGPVHSGHAYIPQQSQPQQPQQSANPYGANQPYAQQPQRTAYTWNPQGGTQPTQAPYYAPVQPKQPKPKKPRKMLSPKFAVKLVAAMLSCAVVSASTIGVFALMIQNGIVKIESPSTPNQTAAFTIYKQADEDSTATPTVTGESKTAQEIAASLKQSVVCIQNYQITQQSSFFGYSYGTTDESSLSPAGEGSGVIISQDGYIVTNQHVVDSATSLKVVTSEGLTYEAELVGEDSQTDLAVIKIINTEDEFTPAEFGSSEDLQVADEVMAIGNPGGMQLNSSVTFGRVSALNRQVENSETGYTIKCIQTDAAVNPGNSGGALVDMNGHVVGIVSSKIVATDYEGLGFAIPSDTAQPIVSDLIEFGYVKDRPMIGISGQYIDRLTASFYGMNAGYYVVQVNSENAQNAGLQRGDMITAIDDTQITSANTISTYIANKKPGDTVTLTVDRTAMGQQSVQIELVLSENTGLTQ